MTGTSKGRRTALGIRCHSGWAAAVLVCGSRDSVEVVDRSRLELCDPAIFGSRQPFHTAEPMRLGEAEAFISRCRQSTKKLAALAVGTLLGKASLQGLRVGRCGMLSASGRALPPLRDILQSHALIHAAEGEFYRDATAAACAAAEVAVLRIRERDALQQAADAAGLGEAEIRDWLAAIGKELGPPWTEDQKLAVLASWIALL